MHDKVEISISYFKVRCIDATDHPGDEGKPLKSNKVYMAIEFGIAQNALGQFKSAIVLKEHPNMVFDMDRFEHKNGMNIRRFLMSLKSPQLN